MAADVRVGRLAIDAHSTASALAVRATDRAEHAIRRALEQVVSGEELVVIRNVHLVVRGAVREPWELEAAIERELTRAISRRLSSAIEIGDVAPGAGAECCVFPSEAVAMARYLAALDAGNAQVWPYSALCAWGSTTAAALALTLERGRAFAADMVAEFARQERVGALLSLSASFGAGRLVALWLGGAGGPALVARLPAGVLREVLERLERAVSRSAWRAGLAAMRERVATADRAARTSDHERASALRLLVLSELFLRWPPLRDSRFDPAELDELAGAVTEYAPPERSRSPRVQVAQRSLAGGLAYWARLVALLGVDLDATLRDARLRQAVRWAVARSLEAPTLGPDDPLLLVWTGAEPGSRLIPSLGLKDRDPEPLFELALRGVLATSGPPALLEVSAWGDSIVAFAGELVFDLFPASGPHEAIPVLVKRLRRRGLRDMPDIEVEARAWGKVAEVLAELDAPPIPDAWRGAVLALTSFLRVQARALHGAKLGELRRWPARVLDDIIEIRAREVRNIANGGWLGDGSATFPARRFKLREVHEA